MAQLTIDLADNVLEHAEAFGRATQRDAAAVLADTLEMAWPASEDVRSERLFRSVEVLTDAEVLELAELKMDSAQNGRLGELQARGKRLGLTPGEEFELLTLLNLYRIGQFRKSEGLAEAVRRGLRSPLKQ